MASERRAEHVTSISRRQSLKLTGVLGASAAGLLYGTGGAGVARATGAAGPTRESTLIATWRGEDPTTAITVQWLSSTESSRPVSLRSRADDSTTDAEMSVAQFGTSSWYRHRAEFTGLTPDEEYVLVSGLQFVLDGDANPFVVRTAPDTLNDPLTFAEGGDVGTAPIVPDLHAQAASWDPLFGFVGGDLAYANGVNEDAWITFLEHWSTYMRSGNRMIPIIAAIGNHEVEGGMNGTPEDAPFYYSLFDNTQHDHAYWAQDFGDYLSILVLDTNHSTQLTGEQMSWFDTALDVRRNQDHLMVAYHVPAYPSAKPITGAGRERESVRSELPPRFDEYDIDVAFEHDDHTYKRTKLLRDGEQSEDGILYLGDGSWGIGPRSVQDRDYLAVAEGTSNVIRVEISPDGTRAYRAVDAEGNLVDEYVDERDQVAVTPTPTATGTTAPTATETPETTAPTPTDAPETTAPTATTAGSGPTEVLGTPTETTGAEAPTTEGETPGFGFIGSLAGVSIGSYLAREYTRNDENET